jgi:hypothetical protein
VLLITGSPTQNPKPRVFLFIWGLSTRPDLTNCLPSGRCGLRILANNDKGRKDTLPRPERLKREIGRLV